MDFIARFIGSAVILGTALGTMYLVSQKLAAHEQPIPLEALREAYITTVMSPFVVQNLLSGSRHCDVKVYVNSKLM
jgi:hypothetical protein